MMASSRISATSSGVISGSGLAMAKMIGLSAIERTMSAVSAPFTDRPKKTSAPSIASASVRALVSTAWSSFHSFIPSLRPLWTTPLVSQSRMLSALKPIAFISDRQAMPAAPAPLQTSFVAAMSRPVRSSAFMRPAMAMIAVPCWSSWKTGMSRSPRSSFSMVKHSGARMSSRLMPPKVRPR